MYSCSGRFDRDLSNIRIDPHNNPLSHLLDTHHFAQNSSMSLTEHPRSLCCILLLVLAAGDANMLPLEELKGG